MIYSHVHVGGAAAWAGLEAAFGAGTVLGGLTALRLAPGRPLLFANLCFLLAAPSSFAFGIPAPLAAIVVARFITGWSVGLYVPVWNTFLQGRIPDTALSRVSAHDWMGSLVSCRSGFALAGPIAAAIGVSATLIFGGVFCVIVIAAASRSPRSGLSALPPPAGQRRGRCGQR